MYAPAYVIEYIVAVTLNMLLLVGSIKNKRNESLYFTSTYPFSDALPFFM